MSDQDGPRTGDAVALQPLTRVALRLPDWLPSTRGNVAAHAWRLAYGDKEAVAIGIGQPGMDRSTDLVVGAVEATEEVVMEKLANGPGSETAQTWISDEVGGWVRDFLADHASRADPRGQAATCRELGVLNPTGSTARKLLFEFASDIAQALADGMLAAAHPG